MNTFDLTCQKTHILAWLNSDDTLSLKINGVKYFASSRTDKKGAKYWKLDSLVSKTEPETPNFTSTSLNKEEQELVKSYQQKIQAWRTKKQWPKEGITNPEWNAFRKWENDQKSQKESLNPNKLVETLKEKNETLSTQ